MDYRPIACDFHDDLEAYAVSGRRVRILHAPADAADAEAGNESAAAALRSEGRIRDIFTNAQKEEFLVLDDGTSIRLDRIRSVDGLADPANPA